MDSVQPKERSIIVVSRKNGQPEVKHTVVHAVDHIRIEMSLEEFMDEVAWQMAKEPAFSLTRKVWVAKILKLLGVDQTKTSQAMAEFIVKNAQKVILRMKESTIYAPSTLVVRD